MKTISLKSKGKREVTFYFTTTKQTTDNKHINTVRFRSDVNIGLAESTFFFDEYRVYR